MGDTQRLEAELELSRACDQLEAAREAMHADRNPDAIAAYQTESNTVVALRSAFREKYKVEVAPGDAAPEVGIVSVAINVEQPEVQ